MPLPFHRFAADLKPADVPDDVLWVLRRSFTDTIGVAAVASTTTMADIARRGAVALFGVGGAGGARILMNGQMVSPAGAAMAGAFTVDSVDARKGRHRARVMPGPPCFRRFWRWRMRQMPP